MHDIKGGMGYQIPNALNSKQKNVCFLFVLENKAGAKALTIQTISPNAYYGNNIESSLYPSILPNHYEFVFVFRHLQERKKA